MQSKISVSRRSDKGILDLSRKSNWVKGRGKVRAELRGGNEGKIGDYEFAGKIEYVKVHEQVTTKDKQNRKKIQPAMLVRKD
jgi:hypothetical protein